MRSRNRWDHWGREFHAHESQKRQPMVPRHVYGDHSLPLETTATVTGTVLGHSCNLVFTSTCRRKNLRLKPVAIACHWRIGDEISFAIKLFPSDLGLEEVEEGISVIPSIMEGSRIKNSFLSLICHVQSLYFLNFHFSISFQI